VCSESIVKAEQKTLEKLNSRVRVIGLPRQTVNILGINVDRLNLAQSIVTIKTIIKGKHKVFAVFPNVFVLTESRRNDEYKKIINSADLSFADGVPLVWASYLLGRYTGGRVSGADMFLLMNLIAEQEGFSCYYLGGGPGGSEKVIDNFRRQYPRLKIVGNFSPPLGEISQRMNYEIVRKINSAKPNILWVGLGSPRQERWIYSNFGNLDVNVAMGVGAAFDYAAGKKQRAPKWMQITGLEWFYRILFENFTLFWKKKYYAYLWEFMVPVLAQVFRERIRK